MRSAVVAEKEILERHGARFIDMNDENQSSPTSGKKGIHFRGWNISSSHGVMADEGGLINLQQRISEKCGVDVRDDDVIVIDGHNLHIPPMLFLEDILTLEHIDSGLRFDFSAADAICCWAMKHTKPNLEIIEVPYAKNWTAENPGMKQHKWDWTYISDYNCTLTRLRAENIESVIVSEGRAEMESIVRPTSNESSQSHTFLQESAQSGININLLRTTEDILFFDDFILYQDDLQDCGECQYSVKVRVMPSCWFILCRLFLRIDGSKILIKDTRIFHEFGTDRVHLEISSRQGQENDYLMPSTVTPASSMQIQGVAPAIPRPNPISPTSSPAIRPLTLSGVQLRDANFMSRILPLHPFRVSVNQLGGSDRSEAEAAYVMKPQLDYYIQL